MGAIQYTGKYILGLILFAGLLWLIETNYFPANEIYRKDMTPVVVREGTTEKGSSYIKNRSSSGIHRNDKTSVAVREGTTEKGSSYTNNRSISEIHRNDKTSVVVRERTTDKGSSYIKNRSSSGIHRNDKTSVVVREGTTDKGSSYTNNRSSSEIHREDKTPVVVREGTTDKGSSYINNRLSSEIHREDKTPVVVREGTTDKGSSYIKNRSSSGIHRNDKTSVVVREGTTDKGSSYTNNRSSSEIHREDKTPVVVREGTTDKGSSYINNRSSSGIPRNDKTPVVVREGTNEKGSSYIKNRFSSEIHREDKTPVVVREGTTEKGSSYINNRSSSEIHTSGSETKRWLIVYWSTYFGTRLNLHVTYDKRDCPVSCEWTSDQSRAKEADAFVVHARDPRPVPPINTVPWILQTQENPVYTPVLNDANYMSRFSYLKSYRLDSDFPDPSVMLPGLQPPVPFQKKSGLIMAAFSNCEAVRTEYMRQLMKFVKVDSFGACLKNNDGLVARYGKNKQGTDFRDAKSILARQYKFTLVFFNQDCDYFVDAQLHHAMNAGSVPVVMATDKLDEFLPGPYLSRSVIKVRDFKSPQLLAEYLKYLSNNGTEYNKYLEWKKKGYGDITRTVIGKFWSPKYPLYCQVCVAVSKGKGHKEGLKPFPCKARRFEDWGITRGA